VTVLERDTGTLPDSPGATWDDWERPGVAQFRQPHNFMPGLRLLLEAELPDIQESLARAGAARFDLLNPMPPSLGNSSPRAVDDKLWTLTARRPLGEWVFANAARHEPRVTIRRGVQVSELTTGPSVLQGAPHVTGVRTSDGEELRADLVVDATGRGSRAPQWLTTIGARAPAEEAADSGFIYYTRYFRGRQPHRMAPALTPLGTIALLTLPGDNDTWSVTVFTASGDQALKRLRHEESWTKAVQACPLHAHWLDGQPLGGVYAMGGIVDRYRRFVVDGSPVATGFVAVADAWACTNPSAGRGLTVGFLHAQRLRDVARSSLDDPAALVEAFDAITERDIRPWYDAQIALDRARFAEMTALREGQPPPAVTDDLTLRIRGLLSAMAFDADLYRAALEYIGTVTPIQEVLARPGVSDAVRAVRERLKNTPLPAMPGPNRQQLLEVVS
jgi:flavin-dependent dehydrogenase